jgi:hypothetical protein
MRNLNSIAVGLLIIVISVANLSLKAQSLDKTNYVVILDLSDRILSPNQVELDKAGIMEIYAKFEKDVRNQLIIKSNARFSIRILPQRNSKLNTFYYNEILSIDMSQYSIGNKRKQLDAFSSQIEPILVKLYQDAKYSNNSADYNGVDIWKFFNESLARNLFKDYHNTVVVITDGYFDFESNAYVKQSGNRYTSTRFLRSLKTDDWQRIAERKDYGLFKIRHDFPNTKVVVLGINPKSQSLDEQEKLHYFWKKWVHEMNMDISIINRSTSLQTKQQLSSELQYL